MSTASEGETRDATPQGPVHRPSTRARWTTSNVDEGLPGTVKPFPPCRRGSHRCRQFDESCGDRVSKLAFLVWRIPASGRHDCVTALTFVNGRTGVVTVLGRS